LRNNYCSKYYTIYGGWVEVDDHDEFDDATQTQQVVSFNDGWAMGFGIGRRYANCWRMQNDFTYRNNTNDAFTVNQFQNGQLTSSQTDDAIDNFNSFSAMTTFYRDFRRQCGSCWNPYLGAGLGPVYVDGVVNTPTLGRVDYIHDAALGYQLVAGLTWQMRCCREFYLEYRFYGTTGLEFENGTQTPLDEFDYESDNWFVGFRWNVR
jgi:opacity protein-like surface antigen